jgi:hypothetical protein
VKIRLEQVHFMPKLLEPGILYVSEEFETAAHLCPCGCGEKIRTPLGPTEWSLTEGRNGPSLSPSIGNWHLPCRTHYWIRDGRVVWAKNWTEDQVRAGRLREAQRRAEYFCSVDRARPRWVVARVIEWVRRMTTLR